MLTPDQEKWVAHLSDKKIIIIAPFDESAEEKFLKVKQRIRESLGSKIRVEHRGATSMGISGQDEIDIYIPVPSEEFDSYIEPLTTTFGVPSSHYPLERARFVTKEDGKHIDVFLINEDCDGWKNGEIFHAYLMTHPDALDCYRQLKEDGHGQNVQEYYRRKIEFINQVLSLHGT